MEKSKKRVRIWLSVLLLVVVAGAIAYYLLRGDQSDLINDGTMINKLMIWGRNICP